MSIVGPVDSLCGAAPVLHHTTRLSYHQGITHGGLYREGRHTLMGYAIVSFKHSQDIYIIVIAHITMKVHEARLVAGSPPT